MKSIIALLLSLLIFLIAFVSYTNADTVTKTIQTYEEDITGDGLKEKITLKGVPLAEGSDFYQEIWANIVSVDSEWTISYGGGYEPELNFINLTQNQTVDLLYSSKTKDVQFSNNLLYIFNNGTFKQTQLPEQNYVNGKFKDKFKVSIKISPDGITETALVDPDIYKQKNIYNENGKLVQPVVAKIEPLIFDPHYISKKQGYGLKTYQTVREPIHHNELGTLETLWYFENSKWIILKKDWQAAN